jgi:hypothetical protein
VVGGYLLASAMLLITGVRLGQMRGYRRVFLLVAGRLRAGIACLRAGTDSARARGRARRPGRCRCAPPSAGADGIQLTFEGPAKTWALSLYSVALAGGAVAGQVFGGLLVSADLFGAEWRPVCS